ncbi:hypothetical protein [uncultured Clostridium sp.]|uniref:hypothetical protein n=1 Tax=uncultured Clostridium sp. TaxID=59620 RepID=UPI0025E2CE39|nr:hypothetical protein [uncultured Clostridium sp.]
MQKDAIVLDHGCEFVLDGNGRLINPKNTEYLENKDSSDVEILVLSRNFITNIYIIKNNINSVIVYKLLYGIIIK